VHSELTIGCNDRAFYRGPCMAWDASTPWPRSCVVGHTDPEKEFKMLLRQSRKLPIPVSTFLWNVCSLLIEVRRQKKRWRAINFCFLF